MHEASQRQVQIESERDRIPWGWVIGTAVGIEVAMVISAFAWLAIYSYLIHPGEDPDYYRNYAQLASPVLSVVIGIPYWFFAGRWVGRKAGTRAVTMCVWAWFIVFILELPLNFFAENQAYSWAMFSLSHATKLPAAYLGGRAALKRLS